MEKLLLFKLPSTQEPSHYQSCTARKLRKDDCCSVRNACQKQASNSQTPCDPEHFLWKPTQIDREDAPADESTDIIKTIPQKRQRALDGSDGFQNVE